MGVELASGGVVELWEVSSPRFGAALLILNGRCVESEQPLMWAVGKTEEFIRKQVDWFGWDIMIVDQQYPVHLRLGGQ